MKKTKLTHEEKMNALASCLRDIMKTNIASDNLPIYIKKGTAVASLISADQREQILEERKLKARYALNATVVENKKLNKS